MISISNINQNAKTFYGINGDKDNFPLFTIGRGSYINGMHIEFTPNDENINIQIGNYCSIARNVKLLINRNHDYMSISTHPLFEIHRKLKRKGQVIIGNDVWIGDNVLILSGVKIGDGAVVAAGSIITKDIPPYAIVGGSPAKIIKFRFTDEQIRKLKTIRWWDWEKDYIEDNKIYFGNTADEFINKFYKEYEPIEGNFKFKHNTNIILYNVDYDKKYSILEKVIDEYIDLFNVTDDVTLLLNIEKNNNFEQYTKEIEQMLLSKMNSERILNMPDISIVGNNIYSDRFLMKNVTFYITNRNISTLKYIQLADELDTVVLSGVDSPVFTKECIRRIN